MSGEQLTYKQTSLGRAQLEAEAKSIWSEFMAEGNAGESLRQMAREAGIDLESLPRDIDFPYKISNKKAGLDPFTTAIIIKVVIPLAGVVAVDIWKEVIVPEIRRRRGNKAIGDEDNSTDV